jgi:hypothetical protein
MRSLRYAILGIVKIIISLPLLIVIPVLFVYSFLEVSGGCKVKECLAARLRKVIYDN